ncbi:PIN-like domain-containing protein [Psychrobacter sp. DAB_AL43B]|uniref:PIN-like domain-containing protein n=1 Tax=Psychrobacter sp. DAB_AL43B TaxID=1028416 RepID=UPI0009A5FF2F|nr:PIN domain-containing protein [Psychrobacter sp. DAB_AL43B]SLJ85861.1 hypothetical protein DABAL43B_2684 [Psychrobacter sp. DAB_AL43B]
MKNMFRQYNYSFTEQEYSHIWENSLFIFDTNILLNLYRYQDSSRNEFIKILESLEDRIWIPHHVALEFKRNRLITIKSRTNLLIEAKEAISQSQKTLIAELNKLQIKKKHSPIDVDNIKGKFKILSDDLSKEIDNTISQQQKIDEPDPLEEKIDTIFNSKVGSANYTQEKIDALYKNAQAKYKLKISPGYLDEKKDEVCVDNQIVYQKKYADYLIWQQILDHVKEKELKHIIFVTDDNKEDWWLEVAVSNSNSQTKHRQPKPELLDDMYNHAEVENFLMYDAEFFLKYSRDYLRASVSEETLQEAGETRQLLNQTMNNQFQRNQKANSYLKMLRANIKLERFKESLEFENYDSFSSNDKHIMHCSECDKNSMIPEDKSDTGYQCVYCHNEYSELLESDCTICGITWPYDDLRRVVWTDEGDIEIICPRCRRDPDYVKDD